VVYLLFLLVLLLFCYSPYGRIIEAAIKDIYVWGNDLLCWANATVQIPTHVLSPPLALSLRVRGVKLLSTLTDHVKDIKEDLELWKRAVWFKSGRRFILLWKLVGLIPKMGDATTSIRTFSTTH